MVCISTRLTCTISLLCNWTYEFQEHFPTYTTKSVPEFNFHGVTWKFPNPPCQNGRLFVIYQILLLIWPVFELTRSVIGRVGWSSLIFAHAMLIDFFFRRINTFGYCRFEHGIAFIDYLLVAIFLSHRMQFSTHHLNLEARCLYI